MNDDVEDALRLIAAIKACSARVDVATPDVAAAESGIRVSDDMVRRALSGLDVDIQTFMAWAQSIVTVQRDRLGQTVSTSHGEHEITVTDIAGNLVLHAFVIGCLHERFLANGRPKVDGE